MNTAILSSPPLNTLQVDMEGEDYHSEETI
jgi:hypothetical protein